MNAARPSVLLLGDTLNLGGTEGQFVEVACGLSRSQWEVHVSCLRAEGPLRQKLEAAGINAWSCGRGSLKPARLLPAVAGLARYLRAHQIRLVHSFDFYSNILGILGGRLARKPVVIASQRDLGDLRPTLDQRVHRLMLRFADLILVNSDAVADQVRYRGGALKERIVVIPNGVDTSRFSPASAATSRLSGRVTIGTLANLRWEKGIEDLVRAAALVHERCPEARFLIWGDGPLRSELEGLVQTCGLRGVVEFRGRTTRPEAALRELDIFVLTSLSEACSNVLLEAMATGLAVVSTRAGGNPELVEEEITGLLVPPGDSPALAKALIRLIEEPALAVELGSRALHRIRAEFGIARMLAGVQALYDHALTRGRA